MAAARQSGANALVQSNVTSLQKLFQARSDSLVTVMPDEMRGDAERIMKLCVRKYAKDFRLAKCTPESFLSACIDAVQVGLDPSSPHGLCWFIPRKNKHNANKEEVNFQIGYKGLCHLARRFGMVRRINADVVVEGETFEADRATGRVSHPVDINIDRTVESTFVGAYAVCTLPNGEPTFAYMARGDIEKVKKKAKSNDFWNEWPDRMWRKSALVRLLNSGEIELSSQFATIFEKDLESMDAQAAAEEVKTVEARVVPRSGVEGLLDRVAEPDPVEMAEEVAPE